MMMSEQHEAGPAGGRDIVDLLHERHEQLVDAFTDVVTAEGADKAALFDELITLLAVHEAVERELILPLAERVGPRSPAAGVRLMDEANVLEALARLSAMAVEDDEFDVQLTAVARVVALRLQVEEREELPRLREALPTECLSALADTLLEAESVAISRASAIQSDARPRDDVGPIGVLRALQDAIRSCGPTRTG